MKYLLIAAVIVATAGQAYAATISGGAGIVDGDTLRVSGVRVRLQGIDAPEKEQACQHADGTPWACGQEAARRLAAFIAGKSVSCSGEHRDRYGRLLAACSVGGQDIGAWMVSHGWAVAYREYSSMYVPDEDEARKAHKGIWSGSFEKPAEWRKNH